MQQLHVGTQSKWECKTIYTQQDLIKCELDLSTGAQYYIIYLMLMTTQVYHNLKLGDKALYLTTSSRMFGRYLYTRLLFGTSLPEVMFQKKIDELKKWHAKCLWHC